MPDDDSDELKRDLEKIKQSLQDGNTQDMKEAAGRQPTPSDESEEVIQAAGKQPEPPKASGEASTGQDEMIEAAGRQPEPAASDENGGASGGRLAEGNRYVVRITDIASKGDGMLTYQGKTVIVPETEQEEVVRIEVTTNSRNFAFAEVVDRDVEEDPINDS